MLDTIQWENNGSYTLSMMIMEITISFKIAERNPWIAYTLTNVLFYREIMSHLNIFPHRKSGMENYC